MVAFNRHEAWWDAFFPPLIAALVGLIVFLLSGCAISGKHASAADSSAALVAIVGLGR